MRVLPALLLLLPGLLFAAADLEVRNLRGVVRQEGEKIQVSFSLTNHGPQTASSIGCNLYMYFNERLIVSQSFSLTPANPGDTREEEFDASLPNEAITSLKVEVFDSLQADTQPSTNFLQINLKPPDYKRVDLQISEAVWETPQNDAQKKGGIRAKLRNNGPERSGLTKLVIELIVFQNVVAKMERRIDRLGAGEESEIRFPLPEAPTISAPQGTLRLRWESAESAFLDENPENNSYDLPVALSVKLPDLVPATIRSNRQGHVSFVIQNRGNAKALPTVTALYINGALVNRFDTNQLQPKGSQTFRFSDLKLVDDSKITVVADFNADVEESSETNNKVNYQKNGLKE